MTQDEWEETEMYKRGCFYEGLGKLFKDKDTKLDEISDYALKHDFYVGLIINSPPTPPNE